MKALVYRNTKTNLPNLVPIHAEQPRGMAYETDTHFVHFFGRDTGVWVISPGLTVTEKKSGSLHQWIERIFGAVEIEESLNEVGHTVAGIWRPGLFYEDELLQGLDNTEIERRLAEQALRMLVQRLDEIFLYIEPTEKGLATFGHKTRELLILACTEVENNWKQYMIRVNAQPTNGRDFNMVDYVRLQSPMRLAEFEISLPLYGEVGAVRPFQEWDVVRPTRSLEWYDAYNKTKHDRNTHFELSTLKNCIHSVIAALVAFCVRFSPFPLLHGLNTLTTLSNQMFSIKLHGCPSTFYVPFVELPHNQIDRVVCFGSEKLIKPRIVEPLIL